MFIARLAGLTVFDPNGDQVGRLRDVVIREPVLRPDASTLPPRVLGLVVEIQQRRRIFVPMGRMQSVEADAVILSTGTLNLRRFQQRAGELLVLGELLDRGVHCGDEAAVVVDVSIEQTRAKDWHVSRVAIRTTGSRFGRLARGRGHLKQVEWYDLDGLARPIGEQGAEHLLAAVGSMKAADLALLMNDLPDRRRQEVVRALDDDRLADVLQELPEEDQVEIIARLDDDRVADVLEEMDPDDAADLLAELPEDEQERLLTLMAPDEAAPVRRLMTYAEGTAGSLMTSEPVIVGPEATIAEALARIRDPKLTPALAAQVFVCRPPAATPTGRYVGIAHFQRLLREPPSDLVGGVTDDDIDPLRPDATVIEVTRRLATYNLVACPVVDERDRLVGAVTVDDVLDALLPEDWRETHE